MSDYKESVRLAALFHELREELLDPITYELLEDPVEAADHHVYSKASITRWFRTKSPPTSPLTGEVLSHTNLPPSIKVRQILDRFKAALANKKEDPTHSNAPLQGIAALSSEIFSELDKLCALDLMNKLSLKAPQVVVLGSESHGKSSLLERLIGFAVFPRDSKLCTRCPIRVQLRRTATAQLAVVSVRDRSNGSEDHSTPVALENICKRVVEAMNQTAQLEKGLLVFSRHEIVVRIHVPYCPNLDILDLPGLVSSNSSNLSSQQDVITATRQIAQEIIDKEKSHSLFLLVVDVRSQVNHSAAAELVRVNGIADQTIGVFTKLDTYVAEDERDDQVMEKLHTNELLKKHGWLVCSNRKPRREDLKDISRLQVMEQQEQALAISPQFQHCFETGKAGLPVIRSKVQQLFEDFLCHAWVPNIVAHLSAHFIKQLDDFKKLGEPFPRREAYNDMLNQIRAKIRTVFKKQPSLLQNFAAYSDAEIILTFQNTAKEVSGESSWVKLHLASDVWNAVKEYEKLVDSSLKFKSSSTGIQGSNSIQLILRSAEEEVLNFKQAENQCEGAALQMKSVTSVEETMDMLKTMRTTARNRLESIVSALEEFTRAQLVPNFLAEIMHPQNSTRKNLNTNFGRFERLIQGLQRSLADLSVIVSQDCMQRIEEWASQPQNIIRSKYRVTGFSTKNILAGAIWTEEAKYFASAILEHWRESVASNLCALVEKWKPEPIPEQTVETCYKKRVDLLRNMLDAIQAQEALSYIQTNIPKSTFRLPQSQSPSQSAKMQAK